MSVEKSIFRKLCNSIILVMILSSVVLYVTGCGSNSSETVAYSDTIQEDHLDNDGGLNDHLEEKILKTVSDDVDIKNNSEDSQDNAMSEEFGMKSSDDSDNASEQENDEADSSVVNTNESVSVESAGKEPYQDESGHGEYGSDGKSEDAKDGDSADKVAVDDNRIVICIDPGHGGSNEGTKETYDGTLIKEKNITLTIARKLKYYLEQNDKVSVIMTRNSDSTVGIGERIEYAKDNNADYVISMHINSKSQDDVDAHGCMVLMSCSRYQPDNARFSSIYDVEKSLSYSILGRLNAIGIPLANDTWNADEYKEGILQRINTVNELYPDGSQSDYYGLINEGTRAGIPTIIVEHAFLSNENDYRNYLSNDSQLDALARADSQGILDVVLR